MRLLLSTLILSALVSCATSAYVEPAYPVTPVYVYAYEGGACWADDVWYGACPWAMPGYGYYAWYGGRWTPRPHYVWRDHRSPPPMHWHGPIAHPVYPGGRGWHR